MIVCIIRKVLNLQISVEEETLMTREEMLEKLHSIKPGVELTALTNEGALECEYVTGKGTGYEWIGMYEWPVARLRGVTASLLGNIQAKLAKDALSICDIEGTAFFDLYASFVSEYCDEDQNSNCVLIAALKSLLGVKDINNGELYVIFDSHSDNPMFDFFADYESMALAFGENYISVNMAWDAFDDEDLALWIERLEDNYQGIPFASYGSEVEEE